MSNLTVAQKQLDAYNAQDLDAYVSYFTEDCVVSGLNGAPTETSREAIKARYAKAFAQFPQNKAELKNRIAEITVTFAAKYISTTAGQDGAIVEGDPKAVREVTDVWTFARDTGSRDPNWTLIATSGEHL